MNAVKRNSIVDTKEAVASMDKTSGTYKTETKSDEDATLADFKVGQRVELHPATDRWMMGDRYGEVVRIDEARGVVRVKLDRSGKCMNFSPRYILKRKP